LFSRLSRSSEQTFAARTIARSDAEAEALIGRVRMFVGGVLCMAVTAVLFRLPPETFALRQTEL